LLGAIAFQHHFCDAAFDHLNPDPAVVNVLRRDDRSGQVETGRTICVADDRGERRQVGLGDLFPQIGLISPYDLIIGDRSDAA